MTVLVTFSSLFCKADEAIPQVGDISVGKIVRFCGNRVGSQAIEPQLNKK